MVNDCNKVSNAETETHSRFARVFKEDKLVLKAGKAEKTRPWEAISILYKPTLRAVMHGCALYAISAQDVLRKSSHSTGLRNGESSKCLPQWSRRSRASHSLASSTATPSLWPSCSFDIKLKIVVHLHAVISQSLKTASYVGLFRNVPGP